MSYLAYSRSLLGSRFALYRHGKRPGGFERLIRVEILDARIANTGLIHIKAINHVAHGLIAKEVLPGRAPYNGVLHWRVGLDIEA